MRTTILPLALLAAVIGIGVSDAAAQSRRPLKSICRVKGQEDNQLHGMGLVVGLNGTGDSGSSPQTLSFLARQMQHFGAQMGKAGPAELKDTKNVALVSVSATVPGVGARQGDRLDCQVSSLASAKSLAGGYLSRTALVGPDPKRAYAFAEGPIELDNPKVTATVRVVKGCQLEEDFFNPFVLDGKITLVLEKSYADFQVAAEVVNLINRGQVGFQSSGSVPLARAIDQNNIEVLIPPQYARAPVEFVSQVLRLDVPELFVGPRVVVNKRSGYVVMSHDVEIGPALINHKSITIDIGNQASTGRFVPLDPRNEAATLKSLVEALNAVHVPTEDVIDIIRGLQRDAKLRAELVIE